MRLGFRVYGIIGVGFRGLGFIGVAFIGFGFMALGLPCLRFIGSEFRGLVLDTIGAHITTNVMVPDSMYHYRMKYRKLSNNAILR